MKRKSTELLSLFVLIFVFFSKASSLHSVSQQNLMQKGIEHVVVLVLENRSFDNILGWLYNEDAPLHFIPSNNTLPFQGLTAAVLNAYANPLKTSSGEILYSCPPIYGLPSIDGSKLINSPMMNPNEAFNDVTKQIFGHEEGTRASMLGFLQNYASHWDENKWIANKLSICSVMESYTAEQLPVLHGLARHYAVSDLWFSSVPTQTNPNRAFLACGTSEGQVLNGWLGKSSFDADTIWNRLASESSSTSWMIFWQTDLLPGIFPGPFTNHQSFTAMGRIPNLDQHYAQIDVFHELARRGELPDFSFIEPQWTYIEAIHLEELRRDFPDSQFLIGVQGNDLHPPGDVRTAENLVANIYTSLIANERAWNKTLFIVLFDEHGGLFDHISPPSSVAPDNHFEYGFTFDRYGVRTPVLFISPLIKKGTVIRSGSPSYPFDHTSLIATLLKWKQIDPKRWQMGARVAKAPTFEEVITEKVPRSDPIITDTSFLPSQKQSLNMGDRIVLKDPKGKYLKMSKLDRFVSVGPVDESITVQFCPCAGKITHGSFALIRLYDPSLSDEYVLDCSSLIGDCHFAKICHKPCQWWTIKSADFPYLGYEIKNGDRVYFECHTYLDLLTYVPGRLATRDSVLLGKAVNTKPIIGEDADVYYWIIEKEEDIHK